MISHTSGPRAQALRLWVSRALPYAVAAALALAILFSIYDLWGASLRVPMVNPVGDYSPFALIAKTAMQTGWCGTNVHLGAPFGFEFYDFPMADGLNLGFFAIFGRFSDDVVLAVNIHYILGYILTALTSLFAFRRFGFSTLPSISAGLLFAFLPYHYMRAEAHLFLSAYYLIPLMILVMSWIMDREHFLERAEGSYLRFRPTKKGLALVVISLLMGSGGVYYAAFSIFFLFVTMMVSVARSLKPVSLVAPMIAGFLVVSAMVVNLSPSLWYFHECGRDPKVAHRVPAEADYYGLKIATLVLPVSNHRVPSLANLTARYTKEMNVIGEAQMEALGVVAGAGFLILVTSVFWIRTGAPRILILVSRLNVAALLVATVGGFGPLFNFLVFAQVRAYARMSIFIAFFALVAVLSVPWWIEKRLGLTGYKQSLLNAAVAIVLFGGLWDLTPASLALPDASRAAFDIERSFIQQIEPTLPRDAMIYQLPYMPFPETPAIKRMLGYDAAHGYLYSQNLRWSYGSMYGRPVGDWQKNEAKLQPQDLLSSLKLVGFSGIWIDTFGYEDNAVALSGNLRRLLNADPMRSADGRFLFFSIIAFPSPLQNAAELDQARKRELSSGFTQITFDHCWELETGGGLNWRWCEQSAQINFRNLWSTTGGYLLKPPSAQTNFGNLGSATGDYLLKLTIRNGSAAPSNFHLSGDFGSLDLRVDGRGTEFSRKISFSPGLHYLRIESDAPRVVAPTDPRDMHFALQNLSFSRY